MNNQQTKINQQEQKYQKLSQVQSLTLEQLDGVYGGSDSDPEWKYVSVRRYS
jgi:hypothetical protein